MPERAANPFLEVFLGIRNPDSQVLIFNETFADFVRHWTAGPTLDATAACLNALEALARVGGQGPLVLSPSEAASSLRLLLACHRRSGGFWVSPYGDSGSLYATLCAACVLSAVESAGPWGSCVQVAELLDEARLAVGDARTFVVSRWDGRSFRDADVGGSSEGLVALYTAVKLLEHMGEDRHYLERSLGQPSLERMIGLTVSCYKEAQLPGGEQDTRERGGGASGFCCGESVATPSVCTTHYGLAVAEFLGCAERFQEPSEAARIARFVQACHDRASGGFASIVGGSPSVNSTAYALRCLEWTGRSAFAHERDGAMRSFIMSCWNGGFAFAPGLTPNAFATKYVGELLLRLQFDPATRGSLLRQVRECVESLRDGLGQAVFRGFPADLCRDAAEAFSQTLSVQQHLLFLGFLRALRVPGEKPATPAEIQKREGLLRGLVNALAAPVTGHVFLSEYPLLKLVPAPGDKLEPASLKRILGVHELIGEAEGLQDLPASTLSLLEQYSALAIAYVCGHLRSVLSTDESPDTAAPGRDASACVRSVLALGCARPDRVGTLSTDEQEAFLCLAERYAENQTTTLREIGWSEDGTLAAVRYVRQRLEQLVGRQAKKAQE
jgi:hypothetical protein